MPFQYLTVSIQGVLEKWNSISCYKRLFSKYCYMFPDMQLKLILKIHSEHGLTSRCQFTAVKISYK